MEGRRPAIAGSDQGQAWIVHAGAVQQEAGVGGREGGRNLAEPNHEDG
jgi:hypothetical protein